MAACPFWKDFVYVDFPGLRLSQVESELMISRTKKLHTHTSEFCDFDAKTNIFSWRNYFRERCIETINNRKDAEFSLKDMLVRGYQIALQSQLRYCKTDEDDGGELWTEIDIQRLQSLPDYFCHIRNDIYKCLAFESEYAYAKKFLLHRIYAVFSSRFGRPQFASPLEASHSSPFVPVSLIPFVNIVHHFPASNPLTSDAFIVAATFIQKEPYCLSFTEPGLYTCLKWDGSSFRDDSSIGMVLGEPPGGRTEREEEEKVSLKISLIHEGIDVGKSNEIDRIGRVMMHVVCAEDDAWQESDNLKSEYAKLKIRHGLSAAVLDYSASSDSKEIVKFSIARAFVLQNGYLVDTEDSSVIKTSTSFETHTIQFDRPAFEIPCKWALPVSLSVRDVQYETFAAAYVPQELRAIENLVAVLDTIGCGKVMVLKDIGCIIGYLCHSRTACEADTREKAERKSGDEWLGIHPIWQHLLVSIFSSQSPVQFHLLYLLMDSE
ncbi:hypothetical protein BKA69DRAFT_1035256 [Paraphysoderma sedebokerense]|nr:hypothetical protein BKA69DRAFT_1035256 [Paraphysoderma sedebokerense]